MSAPSPVKVRIEVKSFDRALHSPAEIAEIRHGVRIWQYHVQQSLTHSDFLKPQDDLLVLEDFYVKAGGNFFVAQDADSSAIVGFVGLLNKGGGVGMIKRMAVIPEYHRQGIGTRLLKEAIAWAQEKGFQKLTLTTGDIEQAKPVYDRLGFQEISSEVGSKDLTMELDLNADLATD